MSAHPEYQTPYEPPVGAGDNRVSAMAWATLLFGLASWIVLPLIGAGLALVIGLVEWRRIAEKTSCRKGRTPVKIGLFCAAAQFVVAVFVGGVGMMFLLLEILGALVG